MNDTGHRGGHTKTYKRVFAVICHVSKNSIQSNNFDNDSSAAILDNSENTHSFYDESMFFGKLHEGGIYGVEIIVGIDFKPAGIGTVKWSWKDDEVKSHNHRLERALYFSESPVTIISPTALDDQYDDEDGTYTQTKRRNAECSWNFGQ